MPSSILPKVQNYNDYREYLRDWFEAGKKINPKLSFRYVARHLGLKAPNHFQLVISKQRHFSKTTLDRMQSLLRLRPKEKNYFELMFSLATETRSAMVAETQSKMARLQTELSDGEAPAIQLSMLSNSLAWFLKMGALRFNQRTYEQIHALVIESCPFPVEETDIQMALSVLTESGVVKFEDNLYVFELDSLRTGWDMDDKSIKQFHRNNLTLAMQTLPWPVKNRYHSNVTIPCNAAVWENAKKEIRDLCLRLLEHSNSVIHAPEDCQQVVSLQFAMFPYFNFH